MRRLKLLMAGMASAMFGLAAVPAIVGATPSGPPSNTVIIKQADLDSTSSNPAVVRADGLNKWFMYNDSNDTVDNTLGSFVSGPATPPNGVGSVQFTLGASPLDRKNIATYRFAGTPLASITKMSFVAYSHSGVAGATESPYLNFNVDFTGSSTAWQKRLVYVPSGNGAVPQDTWNTYDTINGGNAMWVYSGATWPVTGGLGTTAKSWSQILSDYPGIRVNPADSWLGVRVGEPGPTNYVGNVDAFTLGTASGTTTFDFEPTVGPPTSKTDCKNNGWKTFNNPSFKNQGKCIEYVEKHSAADEVRGTLKLSNPSQKISFNINDNDDDHEHNHHSNRWWHRNHKDTVEYWNYDYPGVLHYKADVMCVGGDKSTGEARVMFQIPDGHPGLSGLYIVAYVKEVKHGTDLYGHAATGDLATATAWCNTGVGFNPGMYPVTQGKVEVN